VALFVASMENETTPQDRVLGALGGADQVASALGFRFREPQQVPGAQPGVVPDKALQRAEDAPSL
jgi:hypothetical protein